ncbi:MAG TPA: Holliday junction resolvase RuvX [Gammaproteobacteria bacterium]|nr:Holliday junction resolvase RuvX [Gammaproteobacteria bacterium]
MPSQVLLGFDYGQRRIGVAVGQTVTATATALATLAARDGQPDWAEVTALIEEWRPDALVVGLPLRLDGTESELSRAAQRFARRLEGRYKRPVHLMDERLSSRTAEQTRTRDGARQGLDALAAQVILQDWFELFGETP